MILAVLSGCAWAQAETDLTAQGSHVTLLMDWTRGDLRYGPDYIHLERPCETGSCYCSLNFKVISSRENAKRFADYITSFEHAKVPVVYDVFFTKEGRLLADRLVSVGDWTRDRFPVNDTLLAVVVRFAPSPPGQKVTVKTNTGDCFPSQQK